MLRPMILPAAAALFALSLPLIAQDPAAAATEGLFYKAYWLEKGERNFAEAMTLYEQFLQAAPEHRLAKQAAGFEFELLTKAGKTKDAEAFAKKYEKLLGNVAVGAPAATDAGAAAGRGRGEGRGADARGGAPGDMAARIADLKKQLEEAKAAGETEKAAQLEQRIRRMEQMGQGGEGARGAGGGRRGGNFAPVEFAKMDKDQLATFKTERLERMTGMIERLRENGMDDRAKQLEDGITALKKAIDDGKLDEAQKLWDKMTEGMRGGRRGGGGGGGGGGGENGGGRPNGGGGGGGGGR